jgi:hypothetical protein
LNATAFSFAPDVIFSVDSAAKWAAAIGGVTTGIVLVLNFWYQFLCNGAIAAKSQVCSNFRILVTLLDTDPFTQGPTPRHPRRLLLLPLLSDPDFLHADILNRPPRCHVLRFLPNLAGTLVILQHLLSGAHRIVLGICWAFKKIDAGFARSLSRSEGVESAGNEKDDDSPNQTTDIAKDEVV